jgi:hypothetical protein
MEDKRKKNLKEALILVIVLALAFVGLWLLAENIEEGQRVEPAETEIMVSMRIENGDEWTVEYINVETRNNTVFKLLMECAKVNDFTVDYTQWQGYDAVFVNSINGTQNGDDDMWWQYYVNGEYGDLASDKKEIFEGDTVEWRFVEPGQ